MSETTSAETGVVRFGIIGTGAIARIVRPAFLSGDRARAVAVADVNEEAAGAEARELGGARQYADYRDLLADPQVDAVYIATPPFLHREMVLAALEAGKHALCEKPFMMDRAETRLVAAAHAERFAGLRLASCSSRFHAAAPARAAREIIASGGIGPLLRVRMSHALPPPGPLSRLPAWKQKRSTNGGGIAMDWGVYDLDWLGFVLGDRLDPLTVYGRTDRYGREDGDMETSFSAEILLADGCLVQWERRVEQGPAFGRIEIRGSDGGLDLPLTPGGTPQTLVLHRYDGEPRLQSEVRSKALTEWAPILQYPIHDFASAILEARPAASPPRTQLVVHGVIDALYASTLSGRVEEVDRS